LIRNGVPWMANATLYTGKNYQGKTIAIKKSCLKT